MTLPDLALQWVYARLGWGIVLAACVVIVLPQRITALRKGAALAGGCAFASMWLPGAASPAYWLGLVFQYPSTMLVACCAAALSSRWSGLGPAFHRSSGLAWPLALGGAILYADSAGWLNLQIYAWGFDPRVAAAATLALAVAAAFAVRNAGARGAGLALLVCSVVFSLFRLPSGNVFDALIDPLLWCWAVGATLAAAARWLLGSAPRRRSPAA